MEAKELMLGDWVYNTHNQKNERVQEIGSGLVMLNYNDLYEYDEIEPISLTQEILEKNGFSQNGLDIALFDSKGGEDFVGAANLEYVHELQHALRLCGIDKTIEL